MLGMRSSSFAMKVVSLVLLQKSLLALLSKGKDWGRNPSRDWHWRVSKLRMVNQKQGLTHAGNSPFLASNHVLAV